LSDTTQSDRPLYITSDPKEYAEKMGEKLKALGCSPAYIAEAKRGIIARAVQVKSSWEANMTIQGKA